jgi:hypothetical protein
MTLPMDTMLDDLGPAEGVTGDALAIMKALYLTFEPLQAAAAEQGWSKTQLINAAETARRAGVIRIVYIEDREVFELDVTDYGKTLAARKGTA